VTNNDVLRSLRYALELDNATLVEYFALADVEMPLSYLASLLKKDDEPGFEPLSDELLVRLLDGFVTKLRGPREGGPAPATEAPAALTNNQILRSLRIGLELKDTDVLAIMQRAGVTVSKSELGALFRREDHRNYQPCGDQFLRNFLKGVAQWHRTRAPSKRGA
jgi:uncharacterized protein YehS (DUF1456 family)